ncbi:polysaccharide pyruvyl transferase family protein [Georgenia sp. EYE_87]|uniref:polysaccharide pyruvyl transferase family protein n=1 Tax=Georgenia sp. EYE_87 TaxID=2853448 RepID=UPI0035A84F5F|nr:polysaccharide pyruvyl transferase family protein [Georgenia sp. EYE_87]
MKLLVMWAEPESPNFGVRALAEGVAAGVPDGFEVTFASHATPLSSGSLSLKRLTYAAVSPVSATRKELRSYDLIIDVGEGDSFASIYGWKRFGKMTMSKIAARRSGTPYILAPQTLGPWRGHLSRALAKRATDGAVTVWARDHASRRRAESLGIRNVQLGSDLVFAIAPPRLAGDQGMRDVLLNVSGLLWSVNPHVDSDSYREYVRTLVGGAIADGIRVTLLVHVASPGSRDDDMAAAVAVRSEFPTVDVIAPTSLSSMRTEIARSRLVVGSRMHACLNAISVGVPTVALAYSDKFAPLFSDLGYGAVIDLRSGSKADPTDLRSYLENSALVTDALEARALGRRKVELFFRAIEDSIMGPSR